MAGILDLLNSDLGKTIISGVSGSTGTDQGKTSSVLTMALPVLMKAMERNASTPEGAQGLMGALSGKHNGSILDNLGGLFGGGVDEEVTNDGSKILNHVLGSKQQGVEQVIGQKAGLDSGAVANEQSFLEKILDADGDGSVIDDVAGMVLGGSKSSGGLGGLLGGLFGK